MRRGIAPWVVGVIKIPERGQSCLIAVQAPEHVFADLITGALHRPNPHLFHLTFEILVITQAGQPLPVRPPQKVVVAIADHGKAARFIILGHQRSIEIQTQAARAGHQCNVAPFVRLDQSGHRQHQLGFRG